MINQEIKGNLAKLLATENLIIEHRKVPTASFDTVRRVLTLPVWDKASATVYDMLVGHEVGHALFTPDTDWTEIVRNNVPKDFVNVVEDARIEKLMKRKFPGLSRSFYQGYEELNDQDFFDIQEVDLERLSFIDRINLHFKVGGFAMIPFANDAEQQFIARIADAETFEEVLAICEDIVDYLKQQEKQQTPAPMPPQQQGQQGETEEGEQQQEESPQQQQQQQEGEEGDEDEDLEMPESAGPNGAGDTYDENESKTQRAFDENAEELANNSEHLTETAYVELPELYLDRIIVDSKDLTPYITNAFSKMKEERMEYWGDIFEGSDTQYTKFKKSSQKEVNYLVKEFECKKSADAYARQATSRTGVLDTKALHTYKYNDDLFKKVTVLPDGKNHGMIFVLDWSGSMGEVILDTVKQLLNLTWFCKKVQIPFEVYAFTNEWHPALIDPEYDSEEGLRNKCKSEAGKLDINKHFTLLNMLSSRTNAKQFEEQCLNLFRCAYAFNYSCSYHVPHGLGLSGTPLNESIVALNSIIPQFKNDNKLQKVNCVILTDGEGCDLAYNYDYPYGIDGLGRRRCPGVATLRDRKLGRTYKEFSSFMGEYDQSMTAILLQNLKDRNPDVNILGFRICSGSDFSRFYRYVNDVRSYTDVPDQVMKNWRKFKSLEMSPAGYDAFYAISASGMNVETEFTVAEDASVAQVRKAFRDNLRKKTTNKKLLSSFAALVA
jgi:flagellar motor protein MotB